MVHSCCAVKVAGDDQSKTQRLRVPSAVHHLLAALQDVVAVDVAARRWHRHRRRFTPSQGPAHLGHRVRLRQDQDLHQKHRHRKPAFGLLHLT